MSYIYKCSYSIEEDRPEIDFMDAENAKNDWLLVSEVIDGLRPIGDFPKVSVTVRHPDATNWDCYCDGGVRGLFSERFVEAIGQSSLIGLTLLPALLNGVSYYFLRCDQPVDCFDRENSEFETYPHDPKRIMDISHYAFGEDCLPMDCFFCIPETRRLLLTESMAIRLSAAGLKGICLTPLP